LHFGKVLKNQDYFGEEALKHQTLHDYSTICLTDTHLFTLSKEYYNEFLLEKVIKSEKRMSNYIKKIFLEMDRKNKQN